MRKNVSVSLIGVVAGSIVLSMGATANPTGVPVADPTPLSCATTNYSITAITGAGGEFPISAPCNPSDATQGTCAVYGYRVSSTTGQTISQSLFAVSADQDLYGTTPSSFVANPGIGDSTTGFLKFAQHEYSVRFNANATVFEGYVYIRGASSARVGTAYIRGGKVDESCLIAGPGVPGNPFTPITSSQEVVAAGGKCAATLKYGANGKLTGIILPPGSPCFTGKIPDGNKAAIGGEPIQDTLEGPITFGTGTTTVYLPSGYAICTAQPCPGTTTYVRTR
jgi:hypothetical protein